ncbi:MAG: GTPase HflX, partial [Methylococcales bacterium]|nr:GTPase HflX [Methylococcales bacterium]
MIERPKSGERALLVSINFHSIRDEDDIDEFKELVMSAGVEPIITVHGSRNSPDPKYFIGVGKAEEIKQSIDANEIEIVLFNHALMP